jgi:hypothetical protein
LTRTDRRMGSFLYYPRQTGLAGSNGLAVHSRIAARHRGSDMALTTEPVVSGRRMFRSFFARTTAPAPEVDVVPTGAVEATNSAEKLLAGAGR